MRIGRRLHRARTLAGLAQWQVAAMIGCTQAAISDYERGIRQPKAGLYRRAVEAVIANLVAQRKGAG